jgi:hypothetical protein
VPAPGKADAASIATRSCAEDAADFARNEGPLGHPTPTQIAFDKRPSNVKDEANAMEHASSPPLSYQEFLDFIAD